VPTDKARFAAGVLYTAVLALGIWGGLNAQSAQITLDQCQQIFCNEGGLPLPSGCKQYGTLSCPPPPPPPGTPTLGQCQTACCGQLSTPCPAACSYYGPCPMPGPISPVTPASALMIYGTRRIV
jgi:hypothetical protein